MAPKKLTVNIQKKCEVIYYPYCFQTLACIHYLLLRL